MTDKLASDPEPAAGASARPLGIGGALRAGLGDLVANSWRVLPANLVFGVVLLVVLGVWVNLGALPAAVLGVLLAAPIAGLFRLGAMATRGREVSLSDGIDAMHARPARLVLAGAAFTLASLVFLVDLVGGLLVGGVAMWASAVFAVWGLLVTFAFGFAFWPLAVDPDRALVPWRSRARLAGLLLLAQPLRTGALTLVLVALLAVSVVTIAPILVVGAGLVALIACRWVLPAADVLEERLGRRVAAPADGDAGVG